MEDIHLEGLSLKKKALITPELVQKAKELLDATREKNNKSWEGKDYNSLVYFVGGPDHKFWQFRLEEMEALGEMFAGEGKCVVDKAAAAASFSPFTLANLPSEEVSKQIVDRSMMVRGVYECYARAATYEDLIAQLKQVDRQRLAPYLDGPSYRYDIVSFGATYTPEQKQQLRDQLAFLQPQAAVQYNKPASVFAIFVEHIPFSHVEDSELRQSVSGFPAVAYYFGRRVVDKDPTWTKFDLKQRPYIGPTSCDAQLAFLMANLGKVQPRNSVYDPFAGTGSILVAAAKFGAQTTGQDLDWRVLHGRMRGKQATIFDNFAHYSFSRPDLVCADTATPAWRLADQPRAAEPRCVRDPRMSIVRTKAGVPEDPALAAAQAELWQVQKAENIARRAEQYTLQEQRRLAAAASTEHKEELPAASPDADLESTAPPRALWDVILSDPPYGIRAGARRLGSTRKDHAVRVSAQHAGQAYVPMTKPYPVEDVMHDLLHSAAKTLVVGGRLVYLLPTNRDFRDDELPRHPCLRVVYNCNQPLQSSAFSRRAIVMEKQREFDPEQANAWMKAQRLLPAPRWALLNESIFTKESGEVKDNGRPHLSRKDKKQRRDERIAAGLPVQYFNQKKQRYENYNMDAANVKLHGQRKGGAGHGEAPAAHRTEDGAAAEPAPADE